MAECLQDLLQCSICLERFTQPKVLPCQHTFCLSCLRGIAKDDKTLACPQCRVEHQLPKGGVQKLPDNMTVKSLLNMFDERSENVTTLATSKTECFDCHKKVSLSECLHCKESVCTTCRASHDKLLQEIQILLKIGENDSEENIEGKHGGSVDLLKEIAKEKSMIEKNFNELREDIEEKITERESNLSRYLDTLEKRIRSSLSDEKKTFSEEMKDELDKCKTKSTLESFKNLLDQTEKGISAFQESSHIDVNYCGFDLNGIGNVKFNDYVVEVEQSPKMTTQGKSTDQFNHFKALDALPTNVNYSEKDLNVIDKHAENSSKHLLPDYAVYSQRLDTVFCATEGQVLMYGSGGSGAASLLSPHVTSCTNIAVTKSGKVLVAECATVHIFDLIKSQRNMGIGSTMQRMEMKLDDVKFVDQICCYGEEFVVLTSNEKKMLIFSEEGQFLREFTVDKINSESRMTVDQEGRIYLAGVAITERKETGEMKGCPHHLDYLRHSQLRVTMSVQIHVYSWTGQFISNLQLGDGLTKTYDYKFDAHCGWCRNYHARNNNSLPDDHIINESLKDIKGLCVDGDGFLSIAIKNQIQVYSQKPKPLSDQSSNEKPQLAAAEAAENQTEKLDPVTSVGRHMTPGGGFGGGLGGVSLMPDGRMIVCEKGANRIVIL